MSSDSASEGQLPPPLSVADITHVLPDISQAPGAIPKPEPVIDNSGGIVSRVKTPDGTTFDMIGRDPERAQLRTDTLAKMREVIIAEEPELLRFLVTRPGISAEYAISSAVNHASPDVKAELLGIEVMWKIAEGWPSSAVEALARAEAGKLPIEKFDNAYIKGLFEKALLTDPYEAWSIAGTMAIDGPRVLKVAEVNPDTGILWQGFEQRAFEASAEEVLSREKPADREQMLRYSTELQGLFGSAQHRVDGFKSENPSEIVKRIGSRMVDVDLALGSPRMALRDATLAGMPQTTIDMLNRKANPRIIDSLRTLGASFARKSPSSSSAT